MYLMDPQTMISCLPGTHDAKLLRNSERIKFELRAMHFSRDQVGTSLQVFHFSQQGDLRRCDSSQKTILEPPAEEEED
jgi:hypothetical protein